MAFRASTYRFRTVYEDFQPKFETAETPEAHILKIHLPGFVIEQVRIRHARLTNMLNVSGERPITGINKWSRFRQAYPVPEGCNVKRLKAKFEEEILTITMSKNSVSQAAAPQGEVKTSQEKAPSSFMKADEPKSKKALVDSPPKYAHQQRDKKMVVSDELKAPSPSKGAVAEPKAKKALVEIPPKSDPTFVEEPRDEKRDSSADLKAPSPSEEAVAEPKTEKAQVETPPESTLPSEEEPRDKKRDSSADLKAPSPSEENEPEPKIEKEQVETPQESTPPSAESPRDKRSVSFADQKTPKDQEDTTTAQKPLPDIEKPADDNQLRSLTPPEPIKEVTDPQVLQQEIQRKSTEATADPNLQTGGVVQKHEEFEPKPTLPMATTDQTDENTQKGPGESLPKTTLTTAPLDPKKQIEDKLQKALDDIKQKPGLRTVTKMQTDEIIAGRRAEDPEKKEVKEKIANLIGTRMPEKGMTAKPHPKSPEKEREAAGEPATIYKEKHTENIIDIIERGIKEVAASTSYAVTNIADHKLKDEEKNLLSMVMAALAAHVSYRSTSSGKPQN